MAAFATTSAAEARVTAMVQAKTWIMGHVQRDQTGTIGVRVIRPMGPGASLANGGWVIINDDATT